MNEAANKYVHDIKAGNIPACIHVQRAVERYERDLRDGQKRGLYFNPQPGNLFLAWAANMLLFTKGSQVGKPVVFEPWQQFHFHQVFGWRLGSPTGARRFRIVYLEIPRKNGKTPMAACVALYMAFFDGEARAQVYTAATKRDQAKICLKDAAAFVKASPQLKRNIATLNNAIFFKGSPHPNFDDNFIHPLSADANTMDGLDVHCGIIDELHAHPHAGIIDVLKTATGARLQPLIYMITTAGADKQSVCHDYAQYTEKLLAGEIDDDRFLGIRYTIDDGDDFNDPAVWPKANPNLGVSKYPEYVQGEINQAKNQPAYINTVKKYDFNLWVDDYANWVPVETWRKLKAKRTDEQLAHMPCVAGLDLANTSDFSALALLFQDGSTYHTKTFFWLPESKYTNYKKMLPHDSKRWVRDGWVKLTPGNVMDDRILSAEIIAICQKYGVSTLSYDRAKAHTGVVQDITEYFGADYCVPQSQNIGAMGAPTTELRKMIEGGRLHNDGNPIMQWQLGNVVVFLDANDNEKLVKNKSKGKIDGVVALINAVAQHMADRAAVPADYYNHHEITGISLT